MALSAVGDVERLVFGLDSLGNVCGKDNTQRYSHLGVDINTKGLELLDLRGRPNLYYLEPAQVLTKGFQYLNFAKSVCVEACPDTVCKLANPESTTLEEVLTSPTAWTCQRSISFRCIYRGLDQSRWSVPEDASVEYVNTEYHGELPDEANSAVGQNNGEVQVAADAGEGPCYPVITETVEVLSRCLPDASFLYSAAANGASESSGTTLDLTDTAIHTAFHFGLGVALYIIGAGLLSTVLVFVWVLMIRLLRATGVVLYVVELLTMILSVGLHVAACVVLFYKMNSSSGQVPDEVMEILAEAEVLDAAVMENPVWVAVFWAAVFWTLLWIASSLTSFIKLRLITNCMKVACRSSFPWLLLWQLFISMTVKCIIVSWGVCVAGMLYTVGEIKRTAAPGYEQVVEGMSQLECFNSEGCSYRIAMGPMLLAMQSVHALVMVWCFTFMTALAHTLAARITVARNYGTMYCCAMFIIPDALWGVLKRHAGSIAWGALLHAVSIPFAWLLHMLDRLTRTLQDGRSIDTNCGWRCCGQQCCAWSLKSYIWLLLLTCNRNVYIVMELLNCDYLEAATYAATISRDFSTRVGEMGRFGNYLPMCVRAVVTLLSGGLVLRSLSTVAPDNVMFVSSPILPVLAAMVAAYVCADTLLQPVEAAMDTITLCCAISYDKRLNQALIPKEIGEIIGIPQNKSQYEAQREQHQNETRIRQLLHKKMEAEKDKHAADAELAKKSDEKAVLEAELECQRLEVARHQKNEENMEKLLAEKEGNLNIQKEALEQAERNLEAKKAEVEQEQSRSRGTSAKLEIMKRDLKALELVERQRANEVKRLEDERRAEKGVADQAAEDLENAQRAFDETKRKLDKADALALAKDQQRKKVEEKLALVDEQLNPRDKRRRRALVIGNDDYKIPSPFEALKHSVSGAQKLSAALKELQFKVFMEFNVSKWDFKKHLKDFCDGIEENDITLFYFSGHGASHNSRNYLAAVDSKKCTDGVSLESSVITKLLNKKSRQIVVVFLDCCRETSEDPESGGGVSKLEAYLPKSRDSNLHVFFGCDQAQPAFETGNKEGISHFTEALLRHIKDTRPLDLVWRDITETVLELSTGQQAPTANTSGTEIFSLAGLR